VKPNHNNSFHQNDSISKRYLIYSQLSSVNGFHDSIIIILYNSGSHGTSGSSLSKSKLNSTNLTQPIVFIHFIEDTSISSNFDNNDSNILTVDSFHLFINLRISIKLTVSQSILNKVVLVTQSIILDNIKYSSSFSQSINFQGNISHNHSGISNVFQSLLLISKLFCKSLVLTFNTEYS